MLNGHNYVRPRSEQVPCARVLGAPHLSVSKAQSTSDLI